MTRRLALVVLLVSVIQGCGQSGTTPPSGGTGRVSGTVVTTLAVRSVPSPTAGPSRGVRGLPRRAPAYAPNEILVKTRPGVSAQTAAALHGRFGAREVRRVARLGVSVVRLRDGDTVEAALARYRADPAVEYAEPNRYRYLAAAPSPQATNPNDPQYPQQWHYPLIGLPAAWDTEKGNSSVVVAVIDTGFLFGHPDLQNVTVAGYDFFQDDTNPEDPGCENSSDLSHGTHVAGTIAAATNNGTGVAGVNWGGVSGTKIMPLRIFGNIGGVCTTTVDRIAAALTFAADNGADVANMSYGAYGSDATEEAAINYAHSHGVTLVAAAGNDHREKMFGQLFYPAAYANVIGVAAVGCAGDQAWYSNFGSYVDLAAPGGDDRVSCTGSPAGEEVLSTTGAPASSTLYAFFEGTSMASPHVAGVAALVIASGVTGPANVWSVLQSSATDLGAPGRDDTYGYGLVNAAGAVGGSPAQPMWAFTGDLSGSTITVRSNMVLVQADGSFLITGAQTGTHSVFAWLDANGNGAVDIGDTYGRTDGVTVSSGATTTGVTVTASVVSGGSPITVSQTTTRVRRP